ncbi:hypothetical protein [Psychroserpens algicola]|uniref:CHRD domain-containing protein n=1 Tax=Psychroserpens algicola TaxID=1719034 RepID=A0ABT0H452_9FLAO|nr:hypothetical protein [Psychroserpens algicola]MCK8479159.1 hypothetical protein [Psychroserpens algicola]
MSKKLCYAVMSLFMFSVCYYSCEQDHYKEPELVPKTYNFNIPNKANFNFSQISENRSSIIPYTNTLQVKNISDDDFTLDFIVFSFKDDVLNYNNLAFIKQASTEITSGSTTDSIALEQTNQLFTNTNVMTSILNFSNPNSDHDFNGLYTGELNVYTPTETDTTFQRSVTCTGFVDYQGAFNFFIENEDENDVSRLEGSFNSQHLISGNILDRNASNLSAIINSPQDTLQFDDNHLTGYINYTNNTEARLLHFNLTKQN